MSVIPTGSVGVSRRRLIVSLSSLCLSQESGGSLALLLS